MATQDDIYLATPTREEIDDVLTQRLTATVATLNPDDSIHLTYVIFFYESGKLYWETASSTRKIKNLVASSTTSFLLQGQASSGTNLMVSGAGTARVITGVDANTINERLRAKYITPEALPTISQVWGAFDDVCVEVTIDKWRSWTNKTFGEVTMAGFEDNPPESVWISD